MCDKFNKRSEGRLHSVSDCWDWSRQILTGALIWHALGGECGWGYFSGTTASRLKNITCRLTQVRALFRSVAQSCPILCDPMDCSMPGLPVYHQLPELAQTHVHPVGDAIQPSHPLSSPPRLRSFPASGSFQMSQLSASGGQSIGVSASTSVSPMNTQDWSPLGWTGWISLQSKGLSRVFNTTVQKHQFFGTENTVLRCPHSVTGTSQCSTCPALEFRPWTDYLSKPQFLRCRGGSIYLIKMLRL